MSGLHEKLSGEDNREHRIIHNFLNQVFKAMTDSHGLDPANPEDEELIEAILVGMQVYMKSAYIDAIYEAAKHTQKNPEIMLSPFVVEQFMVKTAFEVGMRLGSEGRDLFAAANSEFKFFTDEEWAEDLATEMATDKKEEEQIARWEDKLRLLLGMDEEEFDRFKKNDRPMVLPLSPDKLHEFYELMDNKPGAHDHHGHGHGHQLSHARDSNDGPHPGTGQYL